MNAQLQDGTKIQMHYGASNLPPDRKEGQKFGISLWCTDGDTWFRSPEKSSLKTRQILAETESFLALLQKWNVDYENAYRVMKAI